MSASTLEQFLLTHCKREREIFVISCQKKGINRECRGVVGNNTNLSE